MSTDGPSIPSHAVPFETASTLPPAPAAPGWTWLSLLLAAAGLASGVLAWNKVQSMQEVLAQQWSDHALTASDEWDAGDRDLHRAATSC